MSVGVGVPVGSGVTGGIGVGAAVGVTIGGVGSGVGRRVTSIAGMRVGRARATLPGMSTVNSWFASPATSITVLLPIGISLEKTNVSAWPLGTPEMKAMFSGSLPFTDMLNGTGRLPEPALTFLTVTDQSAIVVVSLVDTSLTFTSSMR